VQSQEEIKDPKARKVPVVTFIVHHNGTLTLSIPFDLSRLGIRGPFPVDGSFPESPYLPAAVRQDIQHALQHGEQVSHQITAGNHSFVNTYTPVWDERNHAYYLTGISLDITESKRTEEILRKSEFRLRMLFDSAHDSIFIMDHRTFVDCNEATLRIFQCTRDQIVGQTPYRFSPLMQPDGRLSEDSALEKINAAISGKPQSFEWRHIRYDGTPFDAEVSLNRLDLEGEMFLQAIVRDVSERKRAEQENKRLALVANTTTNMVVIADGSGAIQWVNPAFTRITGYQLSEVIGRKPGHFLRGPATDPETSAYMGRQISLGEGFKDVEIVNYNKAGEPYWVSIELQPIRDQNGKTIQFIAIESDISERKATQQALLDRNEDLIKINAELDRFVYCASHDLRAPIASLLGLIEVARMEKNPETMEQLLLLQKKSLLRLDRFIKDIVDHSRNTRLSIEPEPVHFETMVRETLEHLQFMENVDRIQKHIHIEQPEAFYTSVSRLDIILNNLISNALKYADLYKEQPLLNIDIRANREQAVITIEDNGEGISEEAKPNIFNMFYRGSVKGSGSGLGLYIVNEAVHKLGGTIRFESALGKGTTFVVTLPNLMKD
jgi:PAS domain S-box-containing protein